MNCDKVRPLIEADVDSELDLVQHLALAAHLQTCTECRAAWETARDARLVVEQSIQRFSAPSGLQGKIQASLRASGSSPIAAPEPSRAPIFQRWSTFGAMAAGLGFAALAGFHWGESRAENQALFREAMSSHLRSLQIDHLTDVRSTDQHTVKPWFAGKLDFSPPVIDLAASGFPLAGGRLDRVEGHPAAALVYLRRQHAINLFIWPEGHAALPENKNQQDGFSAQAWTSGGFNFLAISEIPADELSRFVDELKAPPTATPPGGPRS